MTRRAGIAAAVFAALVASAGAGDAQTTAKVPDGWKFSLPAGDAKDGQIVFMRMDCSSCHSLTIAGEEALAQPRDEGPPLTPAYAKLPPEYLAESIIKAHAVVAVPGYEVKAGQAGMGKYNHFMTIQELIDIVAFLKQLPENPAK